MTGRPGFISFGICVHTGDRMVAIFPLNILVVLFGMALRRDTGQIPTWMVEE